MNESEPSLNITSKVERASELNQVWQTALRELSLRVQPRPFDSWIRNLDLVHLDRNKREAILAAPSSYAKKLVEQEYNEQLQRALAGVVGEPLEIYLIVEQPTQTQLFDSEAALSKSAGGTAQNNSSMRFSRTSNSQVTPTRQPYNNGSVKPAAESQPLDQNSFHGGSSVRNNYSIPEAQPVPAYEEGMAYNGDGDQTNGHYNSDGFATYEFNRATNLNPRYIFADYVEGNNNRMAVAAARHVAENPGHSYNPLFIYGNVGLGKTHILHAIGHEALRIRPYLNVLYVSSEKFTNDLINAIRERSMEEFRNRYRTIDILLIDDIQFIAGKDSTQEEFFHTFNALHDANKQIVISSDRPPKAMLILEDRLRSRFEGGLISDIQPPDYETRLAILKNKARNKAIAIPGDVLEFIGQQIQSNIRELEGALTRVVAFAIHNRTNLTVELARQALNEVMYNTRKKLLTPGRVVEMVSQFFNTDIKELRGRSRSQDIVLPRQIAMYIIREETDTSLVEIGQELGGRDHTTVMHAINKIENEMETNPQLRQQVTTIIQLLYSEGSSGR
jgi:chromosomal replication initiator protein